MNVPKVKICFTLNATDWHGGGNENLWAERLETSLSGEVFRLLNSPFYFRGVSFLDVVRAVPESGEGSNLIYAGVIDRGGHSTYMVLVPPDTSQFDSYWKRLEAIGCTYEGGGTLKTGFGLRELFSIDIPPEVDIYDAYKILDEGERNNVWIFQEGHCGHQLNSTSREME